MDQQREGSDDSTPDQYSVNSPESEAYGAVERQSSDEETCQQGPESLGEATQTFAYDESRVVDDLRFDSGMLAESPNPDSMGRLGSYDVMEVLGSGGMGVVLTAYDSRLERKVAIKVLSRSLVTSSKARARFNREARAAAGVKHTNVVTIHSVEEHQGYPFLVMEFIEGITLQEKIKSGDRLTPVEILRISSQIAAGLAAAHEKGVVHRDIKPLNIMLEGKLEEVRITDFGLARITVDNAEISLINETIGTPSYMSPEQAAGSRVDARSDLFSLGVVMYAMFEGYSPFRGGTVLEVIRRISDVNPTALHELNSSCPGFLSRIVSRLIEKNPDKRFQTAEDLLEVLAYQHSQFNLANTREVQMLLDSGEDLQPATKRSPARKNRAMLLGLMVLLAGAPVYQHFSNPQPFSAPGPENHERFTPDSLTPPDEPPATNAVPAAAQLKTERETATWILDCGIISVTTTSGESPQVMWNGGLPEEGFYITEVDFSDCTRLNDTDLRQLAGLKRVTRIQLHQTDVTGTGLMHLVGLKTLQYLGMKGCPISNEGLQALSTLPSLRQLNLMDTRLDDSDLELIARLTSLRRLYFSNTLLTDDGLRHLSALANPEIIELNDTQITDAGLRQLANHTGLRELYLRRTKVTDEGIQSLAILENLKKLDVSGTKVTRAGADRLQQKLPDCEIIR